MYSERVYSALLMLYPPEFRVRFAAEMMQLFRDTYHDALKKRRVSAFWLQVIRDLFLSVLRERSSEWIGSKAIENPVMGIVDLLLIPSMVTANLIALGPILTLMFRSGTHITADQFVMMSGFFSIAIGTLAIVASLVFARLRPTVRLWVKLSA